MKKLLLLSAVLLGAASASQAGVRFSFGLPLPPLPLPRIVVSEPRAPAPVYCPPSYSYYERDYCAPVYVAPPAVYFGFGDDHYRGSRYYGHGDYSRSEHYSRGHDHYRSAERYSHRSR